MKLCVKLLFVLILDISGNEEIGNFICEDGTEIQLLYLCDGLKNCPDGSDETQKLCYHIICPNNTFRCHYGACVPKIFRCDNSYHCADKSDEMHCGSIKESCKDSEFKCTSQKCVSNEKLCNGVNDCSDGSDENFDICDELLCPKNTYRCKLGGCINLNACCNGFRDCIDGSDESEVLCKSLNCSKKECKSIFNEILCPPIVSTRIDVKCESVLDKQKDWIPCNKPLPIGTIAHYECKPYYEPINNKQANNFYAICQPDGTWNRGFIKCQPECGRSMPTATPLVLHGWFVERGIFPWHATIYYLQDGIWSFWCGGSLITERFVITAAHCVWKISNKILKVAFGKYYSNYNIRQEFTQFANIGQIIIHPLYQDILGNYGSDIAILQLNKIIQFSQFIRPVCIDWNLHDITEHLSENNLGTVVGMGITENDTFSERLKAVSIPVIGDYKCIKSQTRDFKKYIMYTSFCAGWHNGTAVCNGDSGGGLVFPKYANKTRWTLQGIVSISPRRIGTSFCNPKYYTIFTKVGIYVDWIRNVINKIHSEIIINDNIIENIIL